MAIAIGIFNDSHKIARAIMRANQFGVAERDMALLVVSGGNTKDQQIVRVSGYLEQDANLGEIRTVEEGVYLALMREGAYTAHMIMWLGDLEPGNAVMIVRTQTGEAPWMAETMRRVGADFALDSESQSELVYFAQEHREYSPV